MATQTGSSLKCGELWLSSIPKNVSNTAPERHLAVPTPNKAWFYINALKELFMKSLRVIKLTNATYYISNSNVIHSTLYTFHHALVIQVMYQKLFLLVSPITNLHFNLLLLYMNWNLTYTKKNGKDNFMKMVQVKRLLVILN